MVLRCKVKGAMHKKHKNRKSGELGREAYPREFKAHCNINLQVCKCLFEVSFIVLLPWWRHRSHDQDDRNFSRVL